VFAPRKPRLNPSLDRKIRSPSLKTECLDRMIFFGRQSLERALRQYGEHYDGGMKSSWLGQSTHNLATNGPRSVNRAAEGETTPRPIQKLIRHVYVVVVTICGDLRRAPWVLVS
jgi:hypothetical protein